MPIRKLRNAAHCLELQRVQTASLGALPQQLHPSLLQQVREQRHREGDKAVLSRLQRETGQMSL